jgi:hypothetical protein
MNDKGETSVYSVQYTIRCTLLQKKLKVLEGEREKTTFAYPM